MANCEKAGMDPQRLARLHSQAPQWVDGYRARSAAMLAARRGTIVFDEAYGPLSDASDSPHLQNTSVFSVASLTKIPTAIATLMLVEDGKLGLNRPLKEYIPEICGDNTDDIEVQHLLTHTSGYKFGEYFQSLKNNYPHYTSLIGNEAEGLHAFNAQAMIDRAGMRSHWPAGSQMDYCNFNYDLLGEIIHRVSGRPLADFSRERIFEPLGMHDTTHLFKEVDQARLVVRGEGNRFGSTKDKPVAGLEGHFIRDAAWGSVGLFSTAHDLFRLGQIFLDGGIGGGKRLLSPASIHEMSRNQIPGIGTDFDGKWHKEASWSLGWSIQGADRYRWNSGTLTPEGTLQHTGAGGHMMWIDPVHEIVGVYLTVCLDIEKETGEHHWDADRFMNMVTAAAV